MSKPKVKVAVKRYRSDAIKVSDFVVPFKGAFRKSAEKQMAEDMAKTSDCPGIANRSRGRTFFCYATASGSFTTAFAGSRSGNWPCVSRRSG